MTLEQFIKIERHELKPALWSFVYFFCLLCSYYILRPVRDEMGIAGGVDQLQWLFTGTFLAMLFAVPLFGAATRRLRRHILLPVIYLFFIGNLLLFYAVLQTDIDKVIIARTFFIWLSVFNLFVVSVFWSFMADLYSNAQARRLFGFIAAGGSAGALAGPAITALLAKPLGTANLLLISVVFLSLALLCIRQLVLWAQHDAQDKIQVSQLARTHGSDTPIGGSIFAGFSLLLSSRYLLGISAYILLYTTLATFLYFEQARIVKAAFDDPAARTTLFATIDFAVNLLTITIQLLLTSRVVLRIGLPATLAFIPTLLLFGFAALGAAPILSVLIAVQVLRRAGNYAVAKPAREMLFTVVSREEKYKAKNVIDTVVYRGGDALSGWLFTALSTIGMGLSAIAYLAVPIAMLWLLTGWWLGRLQEQLRSEKISPTAEKVVA